VHLAANLDEAHLFTEGAEQKPKAGSSKRGSAEMDRNRESSPEAEHPQIPD
jgi:hypothetical protein